MELRRLRYFVVAARELNFRRAAEQLYIVQPGLSQQIKILEREVGVQLFRREGSSGVRLTEPGRILLTEADAILARVDEAYERVRAAAAGKVGRLRIAHTRSALENSHPIVQEFRDTHPDVETSLHTAWTARNIEMLRLRQVDVAFVRLPLFEADDLQVVTVAESELMAVVPTASPLAEKSELALADLEDQTVVEWPREQGPGFYDAIHWRLWPQGRPTRTVSEPDAEHIIAAVADGRGVAVLDRERALRLECRGAVARPFEIPVPLVQVGVAASKEDMSGATNAFIELCRSWSQRRMGDARGARALASIHRLNRAARGG